MYKLNISENISIYSFKNLSAVECVYSHTMIYAFLGSIFIIVEIVPLQHLLLTKTTYCCIWKNNFILLAIKLQ